MCTGIVIAMGLATTIWYAHFEIAPATDRYRLREVTNTPLSPIPILEPSAPTLHLSFRYHGLLTTNGGSRWPCPSQAMIELALRSARMDSTVQRIASSMRWLTTKAAVEGCVPLHVLVEVGGATN